MVLKSLAENAPALPGQPLLASLAVSFAIIMVQVASGNSHRYGPGTRWKES